jgi:hypothetical protein
MPTAHHLYEEADGIFDGIGLVINPNKGIVGIDLDTRAARGGSGGAGRIRVAVRHDTPLAGATGHLQKASGQMKEPRPGSRPGRLSLEIVWTLGGQKGKPVEH